jgi:hypothetical protein
MILRRKMSGDVFQINITYDTEEEKFGRCFSKISPRKIINSARRKIINSAKFFGHRYMVSREVKKVGGLVKKIFSKDGLFSAQGRRRLRKSLAKKEAYSPPRADVRFLIIRPMQTGLPTLRPRQT